jgi:AraC-like DNA-binding protein
MRNPWIGGHRHIQLFRVDSLPLDSSWGTHAYQSPFWRFYQNDGDGMEIRCGGEGLSLPGKRLLIVPAEVSFSESATRKLDHFFIHFDWVGITGVTLRVLFQAPIQMPELPDLEKNVEEIAALLKEGREFDLSLICRVNGILYETLGRYLEGLPAEARERDMKQNRGLEPLLPALAYMEDSFSGPITNRRLAEMCYLSQNHFIRLFKNRLGRTPADYLLELRLRRAAQRLLFTDRSVEQIAEESGFGNRSSFTRAFSRRMGTGPATYRRTTRLEEGDREG